MNIDLTKLRSGIVGHIDVNIDYSFNKEELKDSNILEFNNCKIEGTISSGYEDDLKFNLNVSGTMILPCSISLKPVNYPINIKIDGYLSELFTDLKEKVENTIDIFPIIWENILLEVPLKIVSDDLSNIKTSGEGWKFITEEEEENPN